MSSHQVVKKLCLREEAYRQNIYGTVIIVMLLVYGRGAKVVG